MSVNRKSSPSRIPHIALALLFISFHLIATAASQNIETLPQNAHNRRAVSLPNNSNGTSMTTVENNELIPPDMRVPRDSQWTLLPDGTVTHTGESIITRNYSFAINNYHQCSSIDANKTSFVIVIESFIENFEARQTIRNTWALSILQNMANYRVFFMVGLTPKSEIQQKLEYENSQYDDIIQIKIYEDFNNLTYKSINVLYWYIKYCSQAKMLFKTDDDIYLHTPNMIPIFAKVSQDSNSLVCHKNKSRRILRNLKDIKNFLHNVRNINSLEITALIQRKFTKYLISYDLLPGKFYPEYCSGFGYSMNYNVASKLFQSSQLIPYIGIEDMFITGLSRQKANVEIEDNDHFRLKPLIHPLDAKCAFDSGRITSNELNIEEMKQLWMNVNSAGYYCKLHRT